MAKYSINLLQAELLPKVALMTLPRVVGVWGAFLVFMTLWSLLVHYQSEQLSTQNSQLTILKASQTKQLTQLENQIKNNTASSAKQEKLATLQYILANKKRLHQELTDPTHPSVVGFASAMTELSDLHHKDISLAHVNINSQDMTFSGLAKKPEIVPAWLAKFEGSKFLSGKTFINFDLQENEQQLIQFTVSSKPSAGEQ
jgi:hypothetical protein